MNNKLFLTRSALLLALAASLVSLPAQPAGVQRVTDQIEVLRGLLQADRKVVIAEAMQFSLPEDTAFWPIYSEYRAEMDKVGDGLVKLVLEYADLHPNVPEDRAAKLLKDYLTLEKELVTVRAKYLKKFTHVLPNSKVLRFAQLESRLDLALRLQMASAIPLAPIEGRIGSEVSGAAVTAKGVPGGAIVQTRELTATVVEIDNVSRRLTLLSKDGIKQTVKVGPEAVNFDQIRVGDTLKVEVTEELVVQMADPGEPTDTGAATVVALAPKGAKPGAVMAATKQVIGTVTAIDPLKRTATLKFEDGSSGSFPVRSDINLAQRKIGEKVAFRVTEMVAITVKKP